MADAPSKEPNRLKPFKRILNDEFLVKQAPDGLGVACGCRNPDDFKDLEAKFRDFLEQRVFPEAGFVINLINRALQVAEGLLTLLDPVGAAFEFAAQQADKISKGLGDLIRGAAKVVKFLNLVGSAVRDTIKTILKAIQDALHKLFEIIGTRIMRRAIRMIPQWVSVIKGATSDVVTPDQVREVEGIAVRSYGNPIDAPFFNWHFWFNWNVQVAPEKDYVNLLPGGLPNPVQQPGPKESEAGEFPLIAGGSFEIQWDAGALADDRSAYFSGFPESDIAKNDGPITNVFNCWPMAGMFVWAAGRWVYDCSQATAENPPRMRTMINPPKALATARWAAFKFDDNPRDVPAIQFLFFATRSCGYISYASMKDTDYEFILDLPPIDFEPSPYPIGHTPQFPHNTIVLRPRLLKKVEGLGLKGMTILQPEIHPILGDNPNEPAAQVRLKIPMSSIPDDAIAAGCLLTLGWHDPNAVEAKKVRRCTATLTQLRPFVSREDTGALLRRTFGDDIDKLKKEVRDKVLDITIVDFNTLGIPKLPFLPNGKVTVRDIDDFLGHPLQKAIDSAFDEFLNGLASIIPKGKEEWVLRFGFNGIWRSTFLGDVEPNKTVQLVSGIFANEADDKFNFDIRVAVDDPLFFAAHGMEMQPIGNIMHSAKNDRTLKFKINGSERDARWPEIVDPPPVKDDNLRDLIFSYVQECVASPRRLAFGFDNSPLGIIDPDSDLSRATTDRNSNAMKVKDAFAEAQIAREAIFARAAGEEMILFLNATKRDYQLSYKLKVENID